MTREQVAIVHDVVEFLFPRALTGEEGTTVDVVQLRIDNRIQVPQRFDRYVQLRPPPDQVWRVDFWGARSSCQESRKGRL
jgi:hypothetical protein